MTRFNRYQLDSTGEGYQKLNRLQATLDTVLNNGLSVVDNAEGVLFRTVVHYASAWPSFGFAWPFALPPLACIIVRVESTDGQDRVTAVGTPRWVYTPGRVVIKSPRVTATSDYAYHFTLHAYR